MWAAGWRRIDSSWTPTRQNFSGPVPNTVLLLSSAVDRRYLRLGDETTTASDHVRLLGVTISSHLSIDKHVSDTILSCFYWLRQIRRIRSSKSSSSWVDRMLHGIQRHCCSSCCCWFRHIIVAMLSQLSSEISNNFHTFRFSVRCFQARPQNGCNWVPNRLLREKVFVLDRVRLC